jgi:hypothetical protein
MSSDLTVYKVSAAQALFVYTIITKKITRLVIIPQQASKRSADREAQLKNLSSAENGLAVEHMHETYPCGVKAGQSDE